MAIMIDAKYFPLPPSNHIHETDYITAMVKLQENTALNTPQVTHEIYIYCLVWMSKCVPCHWCIVIWIVSYRDCGAENKWSPF